MARNPEIKEGFGDVVCFWKQDGPLGLLTNWAPTPFTEFLFFGNHVFPHGEQYIMARKALMFGDTETLQKILKTSDPKECKKLGREVKGFDQEVWDELIEAVAFRTCYLKTVQNEDVKHQLKMTGDKIIVEASPYDKIWGIGLKCTDENKEAIETHEWPGKNLLGQAWMDMRDKLKVMEETYGEDFHTKQWKTQKDTLDQQLRMIQWQRVQDFLGLGQ